jgi:hypothetical protein
MVPGEFFRAPHKASSAYLVKAPRTIHFAMSMPQGASHIQGESIRPDFCHDINTFCLKLGYAVRASGHVSML